MSLKPLVCVGSALEDLRELPEVVRRLDLARTRLSLVRAQRGAGSP